MKQRILTALKKEQGFVSGQALSEMFDVSRTAIWKVIHQLKEEGYMIESVPNKGYRLVVSPDVLSEEEIRYGLKTRSFGKTLFCFSTIDSTNQQVKRIALEDAPHGSLVVSEEQLCGKGRRGNQWVSPRETGIWMSLLLKPACLPSKASMLTLVAGLAVVKAIRQLFNANAMIKWPNDLILNGKKIGGILTEMSAEVEAIHYVIVGIGINVHTTNFPEDIQEKATSLYLETGKKISRACLLKEILYIFEELYLQFVQSEDLSFMLKDYESVCITINKEVRIEREKETYKGVALGITHEGELLVRDENGVTTRVLAGEVSVRGLYGYV